MQKISEIYTLPDVFGLVESVNKKLKDIHRLTIRDSGLTPPQYFLLTLLWERDGRTFKELALASGNAPATITGIVDTMEKNQVVRRAINPADRRSKLVMLTEKGRSLQGSTPSLGRIFGSCCAGLEPDEIKTLGVLMKKLESSLCLPADNFPIETKSKKRIK